MTVEELIKQLKTYPPKSILVDDKSFKETSVCLLAQCYWKSDGKYVWDEEIMIAVG